MTTGYPINTEHVAINPTEQKRIMGVRYEILRRDKYCTFPILSGGQLIGLEVTAQATRGDVHHITPISFLQMHRPDTDPNHPLNLITLDANRHNTLHREWVERYGCNSKLIKEQVYYGGKAGWIDDYDDALTSIALIRTHDYFMHTVDPTPYYAKYEDEVMELYQHVDKEFEDKYRFFEQRSCL